MYKNYTCIHDEIYLYGPLNFFLTIFYKNIYTQNNILIISIDIINLTTNFFFLFLIKTKKKYLFFFKMEFFPAYFYIKKYKLIINNIKNKKLNLKNLKNLYNFFITNNLKKKYFKKNIFINNNIIQNFFIAK